MLPLTPESHNRHPANKKGQGSCDTWPAWGYTPEVQCHNRSGWITSDQPESSAIAAMGSRSRRHSVYAFANMISSAERWLLLIPDCRASSTRIDVATLRWVRRDFDFFSEPGRGRVAWVRL